MIKLNDTLSKSLKSFIQPIHSNWTLLIHSDKCLINNMNTKI